MRCYEVEAAFPRLKISALVFEVAGLDLSKPTVLTCGGAVVAPFVAFAASLIGAEIPVYDVRLSVPLSL
jgi:3-mercaptopyruvate sulfurtransferase SseA